MSSAKIVAQVLVQGTAVFGRAFMQAYQNAAANAGKEVAKGAKEAVKLGEMHRAEALEILGVTAEMWKLEREEVEARYEKFFAANDPEKGGSFYLQSKIFRAKEFLDNEAAEEMAAAKAAAEEDGEDGEDGEEGAAATADTGESWAEAEEGHKFDEFEGVDHEHAKAEEPEAPQEQSVDDLFEEMNKKNKGKN